MWYDYYSSNFNFDSHLVMIGKSTTTSNYIESDIEGSMLINCISIGNGQTGISSIYFRSSNSIVAVLIDILSSRWHPNLIIDCVSVYEFVYVCVCLVQETLVYDEPMSKLLYSINGQFKQLGGHLVLSERLHHTNRQAFAIMLSGET